VTCQTAPLTGDRGFSETYRIIFYEYDPCEAADSVAGASAERHRLRGCSARWHVGAQTVNSQTGGSKEQFTDRRTKVSSQRSVAQRKNSQIGRAESEVRDRPSKAERHISTAQRMNAPRGAEICG
jgi:hypothetical protein